MWTLNLDPNFCLVYGKQGSFGKIGDFETIRPDFECCR